MSFYTRSQHPADLSSSCLYSKKKQDMFPFSQNVQFSKNTVVLSIKNVIRMQHIITTNNNNEL